MFRDRLVLPLDLGFDVFDLLLQNVFRFVAAEKKALLQEENLHLTSRIEEIVHALVGCDGRGTGGGGGGRGGGGCGGREKGGGGTGKDS